MASVTNIPSINCLNGLLTPFEYESATAPEVYVVDELELRSFIGVIEISFQF